MVVADFSPVMGYGPERARCSSAFTLRSACPVDGS
jgi:hypothetical protein